MWRLSLCCIIFSLFSTLNAQIGGGNSFAFLNLPSGARMTGLGGNPSAQADNTLDFAIINPSLIHSNMLGSYSIQQSLLPSGINYGTLATAIPLKKGIILPYIRYVSYGKMDGYDATGNPTNTFTAFDFQAGTSYALPINPVFNLGVGLSVLGSYLETYSSYGISGSFGMNYHHPNNLLHTSLFVKNIGLQIKGYTAGNTNPLPLEIQSSLSYKLKHAPFRFTLIGHHLNQWKIGYFDPSILPTIDPLSGDTIQAPSVGTGEQIARHFALQTELMTNGLLQMRFGFDFQRRQEMKLEQAPGLAGFSFGLGLNFRKFSIDYGFMVYSKAGFSNSLGLQSKLSDWGKKAH